MFRSQDQGAFFVCSLLLGRHRSQAGVRVARTGCAHMCAHVHVPARVDRFTATFLALSTLKSMSSHCLQFQLF